MNQPIASIWYSKEAECWICDVIWSEDGGQVGMTVFCIRNEEKKQEAKKRFFA